MLDDLGGLGLDVQIVWVRAHLVGECLYDKGNNWAGAMAKFGAAEHEIEKAKVKEAKLLKAKQGPQGRSMDRHGCGGIFPNVRGP